MAEDDEHPATSLHAGRDPGHGLRFSMPVSSGWAPLLHDLLRKIPLLAVAINRFIEPTTNWLVAEEAQFLH